MDNRLAVVPDMSLTDLGTVLAKSGFFSDTKDQAQAIVKVLAGKELGFGPIASMTGVNIIKGKVSLSANLIAAAIKGSRRYTFRLAKGHPTDKECSIEFFERSGDKWESIGTSVFTMEDARRANLTGDNWSKFPRNMLFARSISNGAKWYCPDVFGGPVYTPDELGAVIDGETGEIIDAPVQAVVVHPAVEPKRSNGNHAPKNAWDAWNALTVRAEKLGLTYITPDPETTVEDLRTFYGELVEIVENVEAQNVH